MKTKRRLALSLPKGFTLVELLIVIAILGILSVLGISSFRTALIKARDSTRKSDLATIAKSLEAYINDHRSYPNANSDGTIVCTPTACPWGSAFSDGNTLYTAKLPSDPSGFSYRYTKSGTGYILYARLENTEDPALIPEVPGVTCGSAALLCNYKIQSSNL
jgi:type II secretion system protein G